MNGDDLNRACIGREYPGDQTRIKAPEIIAYARATNDPNPRYVDADHPDGLIAPPLFVVRLSRAATARILTDPDLRCDRARLVHGEQAITWHRPLRVGDTVSVTATVAAIEDKRSGQLLRIGFALMVDGALAVAMESSAFIRSAHPPPRAAAKGANADLEPPSHTERVEVAPDQARRYSQASGDHNPLHLDPDVARAAGFPGVILHGNCTLAFAARAVVERCAGGNPEGLRRLSGRFSAPVNVPDTVTTQIWPADPPNTFLFAATNAAGQEVVSHGTAEVG